MKPERAQLTENPLFAKTMQQVCFGIYFFMRVLHSLLVVTSA